MLKTSREMWQLARFPQAAPPPLKIWLRRFSWVAACRPQAQRDIIFELRRIAFDVECEPNNSGSMEKRKSMYTRDYKKLGFIVSSRR